MYLRTPQFGNRTYRIGWYDSPPFALPAADGTPTGISIDLVKQAARRRGIALEWVRVNQSSESALITKKVDLWPLVGTRPVREWGYYAAEPWMENQYAIVWLGNKSHRPCP